MTTLYFNTARYYILPLLIMFFLFSCSDNSDPTGPLKERRAAWNEDINYFSSQLKTKHADFLSLVSEQDFDRTLNDIKVSIDVLEDYEIYIKLQILLASSNCGGHTFIEPDTSHFLPIGMQEFSDGIYITHADQQNLSLLGKKILKVGGRDISIVRDSLKKIIPKENDYYTKYMFPLSLCYVEGLKYFGFTNSISEAELEIEGIGNVTLNAIKGSSNTFFSSLVHVLNGKPVPYYLQDESTFYWYKYIKEANILYLKYNVCREMPSKPFAVFAEEVKRCIDSNDVKKFVLDVRNNQGGNPSIINPLLFIVNSPLDQRGSLFVLINRATFSAAYLNAVSFKDYTNCIIVGEPTGAKPGFYANAVKFSLPNSGLVVHCSTTYIEAGSQQEDALYPDYPVEVTAQDYMNGSDPVLQFIIDF